MDVVIYARYSCDRQTEQSIEGQLKVCRKYAEDNGYTIISEYIDRAVSGRSDDRPQFQKMIADSKRKHFNGVIVYKLDRFSRNRNDSAIYRKVLEDNGVKLMSATECISDDPTGILMAGLLESYAEYYSKELAQKVRRGMQINAEKGLSNGGTIPFGYKSVDKHLVIDENTAPYVKKIFEMYADGHRSCEIAEYLNSKQIKTAHGSEFNKNSLHSILKNKKYLGYYKYDNIEIPDKIPRIISDELFEKVAVILKKNHQHAGHNKAKIEYLLTTKLFCGDCGAPMVGVSAKSSAGKVYYYYSCNNARKKLCKKKNVSKELVEDIVFTKCRELLTNKNIKKIAGAVSALAKKSDGTLEMKRLKRELNENSAAIENLLNAVESGQNIDLLNERIDQKRKQREVIEQEIKQQEMLHTSMNESEITFFLTQLKDGNINDIQYRKTLINVFVNSVYVYSDRITIIFNAGDIPVTVNETILKESLESSSQSSLLYSSKQGAPLENKEKV